MKMHQYRIRLKARSRGFHLVTDEIVAQLPQLREYRSGMLQLFIRHTSASLCINENADPTVRSDMESFFSDLADDKPYYAHTYEGRDDMPAHIKSAILGASLLIPVLSGTLGLGTWQGIYLAEHRDRGGSREVIATLWSD